MSTGAYTGFRRLPPMNALVAFEAAARHGRIGLASAELGVTHGAVSKQIRHLEETLDVLLFERRGKRVFLTPEGAALLAAATPAFDLIARARRDLVDGTLRGTVRFSCETILLTDWIVPRLVSFTRAHPNVRLDLMCSNAAETVYDPQVDVAIRFGRSSWQDRDVMRLADIGLFPVCSPDLIDHFGPIRSVKDLREHILLHDESDALWQRWLAIAGVSDIDPSAGLYFHDANVLITAACSGLGIALGDYISCRDYLGDGTLIEAIPDAPKSIDSFYLVLPRRDVRSQVCEAFISWLTNEMVNLTQNTKLV